MSSVLCCAVLCFTVVYCYCTVLHCTILYRNTTPCTAPYCIALYRICNCKHQEEGRNEETQITPECQFRFLVLLLLLLLLPVLVLASLLLVMLRVSINLSENHACSLAVYYLLPATHHACLPACLLLAISYVTPSLHSKKRSKSVCYVTCTAFLARTRA